MKQGEEWVLGINEDRFNCVDTYHSKEEAIDVGRKELINAKPHNSAPFGNYSDVFIDDMAGFFKKYCPEIKVCKSKIVYPFRTM